MIDIRHLSVELGGFAMRDFNLKINAGEYFIILGPTGSGKTVLLESIAGLNPCKSGEIWLGEKNITGLDPDARKMSIVYQDHALFPHLSVKENIVFGLKMRKEKPPDIESKLNNIVDLLNLEKLLKRRPVTLSGGEKQKVALARAIITGPEVLLLDEPLGALDPETRENVQRELKKLHASLSFTVLHVTHDFEEAVTMGERIAVIGGGTIKQIGTTENIFRHPDSEFVARFVMARNIFTGMAAKRGDGFTSFKTGDIEFLSAVELVGECHASIRPEDILVSDKPIGNSAWNCFTAAVTGITDKGSILHITASLPPELTCMITHHSFGEMQLSIGMMVYLAFSPSSVHLFRE